MTAVKQDLTLEQGVTFIDTYQLLNADGTSENITGSTFRGQIRKSPESTTVIATFNGTITDATDGKFQMSLTSAITAAIAADDSGDCKIKKTCYLYSYEQLKSDGTVVRLSQGKVNFIPEIDKQ